MAATALYLGRNPINNKNSARRTTLIVMKDMAAFFPVEIVSRRTSIVIARVVQGKYCHIVALTYVAVHCGTLARFYTIGNL